jgi:hypothetical protein
MTTTTKTPTPAGIPAAVLPRLIDEAHTTDAWYGADIVTAIADVDAATAARRPQPGRHNIGEIALHHAYWVREVRSRLTGAHDGPFVLDGEDWFEWDGRSGPSWAEITATVTREVQRFRDAVDVINRGAQSSPLSAEARFDQVLGIAGHAAYHAGQVQLVKALLR